ncbi:MAG: hypothetical protein U9Q67_02670 [Patescibacteria group bacterium]|nr:hypothetical protein [Patescibacteria group bacterium]
MARNTVERTDGCHVVSFKADPTVAIPKGSAISVNDDYQVTIYADQAEFSHGVALQAHASGVYDCIPVLIPGPVIRVTIGTGGVTPGQLVQGDAATPGEWIVDTDDPAGYAVETAADGEECDVVYVGEQY